MSCKGICNKLKATKPLRDSRYGIGQKRCQICACFFLVDGLYCPCCGVTLRVKPRSKCNKELLRK